MTDSPGPPGWLTLPALCDRRMLNARHQKVDTSLIIQRLREQSSAAHKERAWDDIELRDSDVMAPRGRSCLKEPRLPKSKCRVADAGFH